jgi:hypothetical protein
MPWRCATVSARTFLGGQHATTGRAAACLSPASDQIQRGSRGTQPWLDTSGQQWPDAVSVWSHTFSSPRARKSPCLVRQHDRTRPPVHLVAIMCQRPITWQREIESASSFYKWPDSAAPRQVTTWPAPGHCFTVKTTSFTSPTSPPLLKCPNYQVYHPVHVC